MGLDAFAAGPAPDPPLRGGHPLGMVGLHVFESLGAGHTYARHVHDEHGQFKSDAERLAANSAIPASGAFLDRKTAQLSVDTAVSVRARRITLWRSNATRYTPFITEVPLGFVNGTNLSRELYDRGRRDSLPTTGVRAVLMPDARFTCGFAVLTAYNVTVPAPATRVYSIQPLTTYTTADGTTPLARTELTPAQQFAAGAPAAAHFVSRRAAQAAVAAGVRYWSSDIEAWLADPNAPPTPTLARAYCADRTVGSTLTVAEHHSGETTMTTTPVVIFTLTRDPSRSEGFAVTAAFPSRSF